MNTTNKGIDYGNGLSNCDHETGIRFGVIPSRELNPNAFDEIIHHGTDLDFEDYRDEVKSRLRHALSDFFSDHVWGASKTSKLDRAVSDAFDAISDNLGYAYESTGDCTRFLYEQDGYKLQVASDGDIFILKSPFFTHAQFCSPCAPGACYLLNPCVDGAKAYCLGADWFDNATAPYDIHEVATDKLLLKANP